MLRAIIWKRDADVRAGKKSLETGHDLRQLLVHVKNLGLLNFPDPARDDLQIEFSKSLSFGSTTCDSLPPNMWKPDGSDLARCEEAEP